MNKQTWLRAIGPILHRRRGNPGPLLVALEALEAPALEQLYRTLQDFEQELSQAERTFRPFPGGPRVRI
jgi:hypothetical protein